MISFFVVEFLGQWEQDFFKYGGNRSMEVSVSKIGEDQQQTSMIYFFGRTKPSGLLT